MMKTSFIEKLLNEAEVQWITLGDILLIKTGEAVSKQKIEANLGDYPVINSGREPLGFINEWNTDNDPMGVTTRGAGVGSITWQDGKYFRGNLNYSLTIKSGSNLSVRYLYHLLLHMQTEIHSLCTFDAIPALNGSNLKKLAIPVPCPENLEKSLAIQAEIVRILDAFTELTAELTAELIARKQQYAYYRKQLLTFNDDEVEWKTLKEVALELGRGKSRHRPRNDPKLYGGDVPLIQTGDVRNASHVINEYTQTYSKFGLEQSKLWPKGTLCITIAANIAETTILGFDSCFPDSIIGFVADPEKTTTSYVEYLLTSFKSELQAQSTGSAQSNINLATFERLPFPFPPLTEQKRIVAILDKFDALTTSLTEGLPREIALRQQQYEYYRELLLSFPKAEVANHD